MLARQKEYNSRPEVKARNYERAQTPEAKAAKSASDRRWRQNNVAACRDMHNKGKLPHKNATPSWSDPRTRQHFYEAAVEMSDAFGEEHHVDHTIPIKSKHVCGLHCEDNMQLLTAKENNLKNNLVWPGQWIETWPTMYLGSVL